MTIYLFIPLIAMLSFYLVSGFQIQEKLIRKKVDLSIFLSFVIPFILFAFRDASIGIDTKTYLAYLDQIHNLSFSQVMSNRRFELGYTIFCYVVTRLSNYKFVFLIITSLIMNFLYARSIAVLSPMPLTSTLIYFFVSNFLYNISMIRQAWAVGIVLCALSYLISGKYKKYTFLIIVASLIHTFSVVCLFLIIPVWFIKKKKQLLVFCVGSVTLISVMSEVVYAIVQKFFPHFVYYFRNDTFNSTKFGITSLAYVLLDIFVILLLLDSHDTYKNEVFSKEKSMCTWLVDKEQRIRLSNILCIAVSFGAVSLCLMNVIGIYLRVARFFHTFLIFAVPYAVIGIKNKYTRYGVLSGVLICSFVYYVYILGTNAYLIVPYKFFFSK